MIALLASVMAVGLQLPAGGTERGPERVVAIRDLRILPVAAPPIERGVLLIRGERIEGAGADVAIPPGRSGD